MVSVELVMTPQMRRPKPWWYLLCADCHIRLAADPVHFWRLSVSTGRRQRQEYVCKTCYERSRNKTDAALWRKFGPTVDKMILEGTWNDQPQ